MIKSMVSRRVVSLLYVDQPRGVDVMQLARELKFLKSELLQPSGIISRFLNQPAVFESHKDHHTFPWVPDIDCLFCHILPRSVLVQHVSHLSMMPWFTVIQTVPSSEPALGVAGNNQIAIRSTAMRDKHV